MAHSNESVLTVRVIKQTDINKIWGNVEIGKLFTEWLNQYKSYNIESRNIMNDFAEFSKAETVLTIRCMGAVETICIQ